MSQPLPTIEEVEQAIQKRMDALATADPQCVRWLGQLDILKRLADDSETSEDGEVPASPEEGNDDTEATD